MQWGRVQSHTMEQTTSTSTWRGKFYFPTNGKHETPYFLCNILPLYISLYMAKKRKAVLRVKNHMILLHSMEKETGYASFRSWALLLKSSSPNPGWKRGQRGEIKVQKLNFYCCPWLPPSLQLQHFLLWYQIGMITQVKHYQTHELFGNRCK